MLNHEFPWEYSKSYRLSLQYSAYARSEVPQNFLSPAVPPSLKIPGLQTGEDRLLIQRSITEHAALPWLDAKIHRWNAAVTSPDIGQGDSQECWLISTNSNAAKTPDTTLGPPATLTTPPFSISTYNKHTKAETLNSVWANQQLSEMVGKWSIEESRTRS